MMMKVAVVHPFGFVDSIPTLCSVASGIVSRGGQVYLFWCGGETGAMDRSIWTASCNIGGRAGHGIVTRVSELLDRRKLLARQFSVQKFDLIICVDAYGLIIGAPLARSAGIPLIYFSLELLFWGELNKMSLFALKAAECIYIRRTSAVVIQDRVRADALRASTRYIPELLHELPNAWPDQVVVEKSNILRQKLLIPEEIKIVVHAGSCSRWTLVAELAESAQAWPDEFVLVIQNRFPLGNSAYEARLQRAIDSRRVYFLGEPCPSSDLVNLLSEATIGAALYKCYQDAMLGANLMLAGKSSGKFSTYLQAGLPVIVNRTGGLDGLVEHYQCGGVVETIEDFGKCLHWLADRLESAGAAARQCFKMEYSSARYLPQVIDSFESLLPDRASSACRIPRHL